MRKSIKSRAVCYVLVFTMIATMLPVLSLPVMAASNYDSLASAVEVDMTLSLNSDVSYDVVTPSALEIEGVEDGFGAFTEIAATFGTATQMVAVGDSHSVALMENGTVWAWGDNQGGQLGDGTFTSRSTPVQVQNLSNITFIATGTHHTLALSDDGTVWAWGGAIWLGIASTLTPSTPVQLPNLSNISTFAIGENHSLALRNDGTVWSWGNNFSGQLGDGSFANRSTPVQVQNLSNVSSIAVGSSHSLALRDDGTVWAWGANGAGNLGDGTTENRSIPVQVQNLSNVTSIVDSPVRGHNLALRNDGTVWAWGDNWTGQLGDGTTENRSTPVQVQNLSNISSIAAGSRSNLALRGDGTVWAWGDNFDGRLGDGTTITRLTPVQVLNLSNIASIAESSLHHGHGLALRNDGTVWFWGNDWTGEKGGGTVGNLSTPVQVQNLSNIASIAIGHFHSLALRNDSTVWAWGDNGAGQLGDGTTENTSSAVQVRGPSGVGYLNLGGQGTIPSPTPTIMLTPTPIIAVTPTPEVTPEAYPTPTPPQAEVTAMPTPAPELVQTPTITPEPWQTPTPGRRRNVGAPRGNVITPPQVTQAPQPTQTPQATPTQVPAFTQPTDTTPTAVVTPAPSELVAIDNYRQVVAPALATSLHELRLLVGTGTDETGAPIFELNRQLNRMEALALIIRLMGLEEQANTYNGTSPFNDTPEWGQNLAAFAYSQGITVGIGDGQFGSDRSVTHQEFTAFLLRVIGYSEAQGDFNFEGTLSKSVEVGLFSANQANMLNNAPQFLRADTVLSMTNALLTETNDSSDALLIDTLVESNVITREAANAFIADATSVLE